MKQLSSIQYRGKDIGEAKISKEGLYYRISCRCSFPDEEIHRLTAHCGANTVNLGICVPMENTFGLTTKIPISRMGEGEIVVCVQTNDGDNKIIPIFEDTPFPKLEDLDKAVLCMGGVVIKDQFPAPQDSGRNPEHPQK